LGYLLVISNLSEAQKFVIPVFPDTHVGIPGKAEMFYYDMRWIVRQKDSLNIPFVCHVGDMVNCDNLSHWEIASQGFKVLDSAKIAYSVTLGNHDTEAVGENSGSAAPGNVNQNLRKTTKFNAYFPVSRFKAQGGRCKDITHKLLFFAKKTDSRVREVLINDIIEEIVGISEERTKDSKVKIVTHLDPELPKVAASPSEMQQVLLNLINNAIDAIGTGGGSIEITSRLDGEHVIIDVADTGQGIPNELMNRIFDPFFTTKPVGKGTGLGLSICYGIIKKMGGDITLNSSVGIGTTFHVHLPAPKSENQSHQ